MATFRMVPVAVAGPRPRVDRAAPPQDTGTNYWATFCAEIEERILIVRAEATDTICETCGSSTPEIVERKWCSPCGRLLARACFSSDRQNGDGLARMCRECRAALHKAYRTRRALRRPA